MKILSSQITLVKPGEFFGAFRFDPEFYQQEYIENEQQIEKAGNIETLGGFRASLRKGIFDIKADEYQEAGVPFVRIGDLEGGLVNWDRCVHITPERSESEVHSRLEKWDLILAKTAGPNVAVVDRDACNVSQDLIALKTGRGKDYNLTFAAFLLSRYGMWAMQRLFQGNVQTHLSLPDANTLRVPSFSDRLQSSVGQMYSDGIQLIRAAAPRYRAATEAVVSLSRWKHRSEERQNAGYAKRFTALHDAGRFDPEHFLPEVEVLRGHLRKLGALSIDAISAEPSRRGVQPEYTERGEVAIVTSKHLGPTEIDRASLDRSTQSFYDCKEASPARLKVGDVLQYATGAFVGRTHLFCGPVPALASNHVNILRPDPACCIAGYLAVYLNSPLGLVQSEAFACGSAQRELYPSDVKKILVFLPRDRSGRVDLELQRRIAAMADDHSRGLEEGRAKILHAVKLVEQEIEASGRGESP